MKKEFSQAIIDIGTHDKKVIFMTGDLGYNAFEGIIPVLKERFINAGVAEQNMVSVAAGMAHQGMQPWIYSIAPFMVLKTIEQVRNDICHMNLPVKLVGNGGGYGYGIMGATHHLLEDIGMMATLPHMNIYIPSFTDDVGVMVMRMYKNNEPSYLRLGLALPYAGTLPAYAPVRNISKGKKLTVIAVGPLIHQALMADATLKNKDDLDIWNISELPFTIPDQLLASLKKTKKLVILEEHTKNSGVGEKILAQLMHKNITLNKLHHLSAEGYPSQLYGDQMYHLKEHKLDAQGMLQLIESSI